ncbi:hypothetical protein, conserved [Eimeria necatrix]|uniref:Uncharacterized protein n=1 Tax=Eimeria necatrix TaxID=51315 RepID=U6MFS9_9EIME|nr:hypothetical protein, conserved [Eimeria necatrix]CDJ62891.1 hypothetical protein, conserved [Eimeria necatrix]
MMEKRPLCFAYLRDFVKEKKKQGKLTRLLSGYKAGELDLNNSVLRFKRDVMALTEELAFHALQQAQATRTTTNESEEVSMDLIDL